MSTLGEILERLHDRSQVFQLLAEGGDLAVLAQVDRMSDGDDACDIALQAVQSFTEAANDEAWVKLIGHLQNADAPAAACLSEMIAWSVNH